MKVVKVEIDGFKDFPTMNMVTVVCMVVYPSSIASLLVLLTLKLVTIVPSEVVVVVSKF